MSEIVPVDPFAFNDRPVRAVLLDGQPAFVHSDVCTVLEIGNPSDALRRLDPDEYTLVSIDGPNGRQVNVVTESGLYSLILGSRKPQAKPFKRWVTHEVLPEIRRTGRYEAPSHAELTPQEQALTLARALIDADARADAEKARREIVEQRNAVLEPKAAAADALMESEGTVSMGAVANAYGVGRQELFDLLREEKIIQTDRRPYQQYTEWFRVSIRHYDDANGVQRPYVNTRMYPAGALRLHALLTRRGRELRRPVFDNQLALLPGGVA